MELWDSLVEKFFKKHAEATIGGFVGGLAGLVEGTYSSHACYLDKLDQATRLAEPYLFNYDPEVTSKFITPIALYIPIGIGVGLAVKYGRRLLNKNPR